MPSVLLYRTLAKQGVQGIDEEGGPPADIKKKLQLMGNVRLTNFVLALLCNKNDLDIDRELLQALSPATKARSATAATATLKNRFREERQWVEGGSPNSDG